MIARVNLVLNYMSWTQHFPANFSRYAMHHLGKLISVRWDLYHRSIRDVKLSLLHSSNGAFLQAQMHSQYLWSLSYRPYGTSGFHEDKVRALEIMMSREQPESFTLFQDVWENIRQDLGMPDTATMFEVAEASHSWWIHIEGHPPEAWQMVLLEPSV